MFSAKSFVETKKKSHLVSQAEKIAFHPAVFGVFGLLCTTL